MTAHLIAEDGPHRGLLLDLEKGDEWIIGRDADEATFVVEDDTVSRKHALLVRTAEGICIENLSHVNPILVNDERIEGRLLLKEHDRIQIGHTTFLFSQGEIPEIDPKKKGDEGYDDIFASLEDIAEPKPSIRRGKKEKKQIASNPSAYDTIFEDSGAEEAQLPFNLLSETPFLLKVIAGPNAGDLTHSVKILDLAISYFKI
jgi:pSer/pThr/pTyr-binding forkhead associated (FHA) protein